MRVHQSLRDDCGRRMQYKLEDRRYYGGSVRALGSGYHKGLEVAYLARQENGYFLPDDQWRDFLHAAKEEFAMICDGVNTSHVSEEGKERGGFIWNKNVPDIESGYELLETMLRSYFVESDAWWPERYLVLGVERFFDLPWTGELSRGGSIDLIMLDQDHDQVIGEDHKTAGRAWSKGKEHPRKNLQAPWYSWAIRELYPDHKSYLSSFSIMTYAGKFERRASVVDEKHINAAAQALFETAAQYQVTRANGLDMPANPSSTLCSPEYCDYFNICPHGAAIE